MTTTDPLHARIHDLVGQGYRVVTETSTSAQLIRPRRFNPAELIAMPVYLLEYLGQKDRTLYLSLAPDGQVHESGTALARSRYRRMQDRPFGQRLAIVATPFVAVAVLALVYSAIRAVIG